jgi:predicted acyltransferase
MRAGGCLLAISILIGAFAGMVLRQSSIGVLVGGGVGLLLLGLVWVRERGR